MNASVISASSSPNTPEQRLRDDRRLLGALLGEVVSAQTGPDTLEKIENIRRSAVDLRRGETQPAGSTQAADARAALEQTLNGLAIDDTLHVVRAFSYFLHLVNIAEDTHACEPGDGLNPAACEGSLAAALSRAKAAGIGGAQLLDWFSGAMGCPVLTAHPTEVQRQSILTCEREIARLLTSHSHARDGSREQALRREVLRLWLTAMLRLTRLSVADEIENGLAYFRMTFLEQIPRLYADLESALVKTFGLPGETSLPSFLRVGSWIGGDRDGNPNVTANVLEHALSAQSRLAFEHYLYEIGLLSSELSLAARLSPVPQELLAFAATSATPHATGRMNPTARPYPPFMRGCRPPRHSLLKWIRHAKRMAPPRLTPRPASSHPTSISSHAR